MSRGSPSSLGVTRKHDHLIQGTNNISEINLREQGRKSENFKGTGLWTPAPKKTAIALTFTAIKTLLSVVKQVHLWHQQVLQVLALNDSLKHTRDKTFLTQLDFFAQYYCERLFQSNISLRIQLPLIAHSRELISAAGNERRLYSQAILIC